MITKIIYYNLGAYTKVFLQKWVHILTTHLSPGHLISDLRYLTCAKIEISKFVMLIVVIKETVKKIKEMIRHQINKAYI